jgi:hypothetical protein
LTPSDSALAASKEDPTLPSLSDATTRFIFPS